jgi:hypothetical protein
VSRKRRNERRRERYAQDPEYRARELARCRAYYRARKRETGFDSGQLRRYGISLAEYDALLARQGGVCAICRRRQSPRAKLCVDHCHLTGRMRGLLCRRCNLALGHLGDDQRTLIAALAYLAYDVADGPGAAAERALRARAALPPRRARREYRPTRHRSPRRIDPGQLA